MSAVAYLKGLDFEPDRFQLAAAEATDRGETVVVTAPTGSGKTAVAHYHAERNHQGLSNKIIEPGDEAGRVACKIKSRERLGGLLRCYYRRAA